MKSRSRRWAVALVAVVLVLSAAVALPALANPAGTFSPSPSVPQETIPPQLAQGVLPLDQVDVLVMPGVDVAALEAEDVLRAAADLAPRFAQPQPTRVTPSTHGTWETLANGTAVWRLRVVSPKATSLNLGFAQYAMPAGGQLYLYTPDYQVVRGPFTAADNERHGELWTPILPGEALVIEVQLPAAARDELALVLTSVNHGYREFGQMPTSGACNVDVICPQGDLWRSEIRSVAVISTGGSTFCTGFMVNNVAQDLKPYFMTANHCGINAGNAASLVAYWNYENSTCRPPGSPASGGPGDGQLNQFNTGSFFRASYSPSDFTLVELDDPPQQAFNVHWAGWDATSANATSAVAIHHPNTDEKRISFENDPTTTTSYLGTTSPGDGTHVRVADWDLGTTEGGSSGSPLFNQDHRVIGQLHGGYAACGNDLADWYGRISVSWNGGATATSSLKPWLDPGNTGTTVLNGRDQQPDFNLSAAPDAVNICAGSNAVYTINLTSSGGFANPVTFSATGQPAGTTASFVPNPLTPPGSSAFTIGNTAAVAAGAYNVQVTGTSGPLVHSDTVALNVSTIAAGAPTLLTPANGALNVAVQPTFTWAAGANAVAYDLEIATDAAFTNIVHSATGIPGTTYSGATLNTGTTYHWRVRGSNGCGLSAYTAAFSFTTQAAPGDCGPGSTARILYQTDFEGTVTGWTSGGTGNTWALGTNNPHSPTQNYHANDVGSVTDQRLVSPAVVLPTGQNPLTLKFWNAQNIESSSSGCYDGGIIEISTNGGSTWTQIPDSAMPPGNQYHGTVSSSFGNPLATLEAWCGDPAAYANYIVDVSAYAGQTVQFRWRLGTDSSVSQPGWDLDDVLVQSCQVPTAVSLSALAEAPVAPAGTWLALGVLGVAAVLASAWLRRRAT